MKETNATPGDTSRSIEKCLDDVRPFAIAMDRKVSACTDPGTLREAALERYGELEVQTGSKAIPQWNTQYFSLVLPFVIPRMVSGPDFDVRNRWRRTFDDAPVVTARDFAAGFIRRAEAQCRLDWTALSIVRGATFAYTAEHTMGILTPFCGHRQNPSEHSADAYIAAA